MFYYHFFLAYILALLVYICYFFIIIFLLLLFRFVIRKSPATRHNNRLSWKFVIAHNIDYIISHIKYYIIEIKWFKHCWQYV